MLARFDVDAAKKTWADARTVAAHMLVKQIDDFVTECSATGLWREWHRCFPGELGLLDHVDAKNRWGSLVDFHQTNGNVLVTVKFFT